MRVWMVAAATLYEQLRQEKVLYVDPARCEPEFAKAYAWMRVQMAQRVLSYQGHALWWAWGQKPDLRNRWSYHGGFEPGCGCVRLELEIAPAEVLLSDFELWNVVLNEAPLVSSDAEWDAIEALSDVERARVTEATWASIFDLAAPMDPYWHGADPRRRIQAVFERLRLADVMQVTPYVARPPRLPTIAVLMEAESA